eukprot:scaffold80983_cov43-Attheya_sp.AAC.1
MGKVLDRLKINDWSAPHNPNDGKVDLFVTFADPIRTIRHIHECSHQANQNVLPRSKRYNNGKGTWMICARIKHVSISPASRRSGGQA